MRRKFRANVHPQSGRNNRALRLFYYRVRNNIGAQALNLIPTFRITRPAIEPHNAAQICDRDYKSSKVCIFGHAKFSVAMVHITKFNLITFAQHQGRNITVYMIKKGQSQKGLTRKDFQPAPRIISLVPAVRQ